MRIQTFSILVGSMACNARCPFCVSKMTPHQGLSLELPKVNWRNFEIGCRVAKDSGVSTILLTGKGEPTLFPARTIEFLEHLQNYKFPLIEIQTNGIEIFQKIGMHYGPYLLGWRELGITTIAISVVHYDNKRNQENYQPAGSYMDLVKLISYLHEFGFSVRLSCVMFRGGINSPEEITKFVDFAKINKVEQLTITPVRAPGASESQEVARWVKEHELDFGTQLKLKVFLDTRGKKLLPLAHGATIYDLYGQNICLSDCLTENKSAEEIRQLIFSPDGHLRYDWQYPGAILL